MAMAFAVSRHMMPIQPAPVISTVSPSLIPPVRPALIPTASGSSKAPSLMDTEDAYRALTMVETIERSLREGVESFCGRLM